VNEPLVPLFEEPDVPIVMPVPDRVTVTDPVQTPPVKAVVVDGLIVPEDTVRLFVEV
jgi:hypothetical protein